MSRNKTVRMTMQERTAFREQVEFEIQEDLRQTGRYRKVLPPVIAFQYFRHFLTIESVKATLTRDPETLLPILTVTKLKSNPPDNRP